MGIKAIIFDMDGTILYTLQDIANAVNHTLKVHGLPTHEVDKFNRFVGDGTDKMLYRALPDKLKSDEMVAKIKPEYVKFYDAHPTDTTKPYDKIIDLLNELKTKGIKLAVVSNKIDCMVGPIADKFFCGIFDYVTGQKDGMPVKPDPAAVFDVMKQFNVTADECIFVGDSGVDAKTGANAGMFTVGVIWGFRDKDFLQKCGATTFIDSPEQLLPLLD